MYETLVVRIFIVRECECCLMRLMKTVTYKIVYNSYFYEQCVPIYDVIHTKLYSFATTDITHHIFSTTVGKYN